MARKLIFWGHKNRKERVNKSSISAIYIIVDTSHISISGLLYLSFTILVLSRRHWFCIQFEHIYICKDQTEEWTSTDFRQIPTDQVLKLKRLKKRKFHWQVKTAVTHQLQRHKGTSIWEIVMRIDQWHVVIVMYLGEHLLINNYWMRFL